MSLKKFQGRVRRFPFDDHNVPPLSMIKTFCEDLDTYLSGHEDNIAAIHCKAGKGRTGLMISCYLLYAGIATTADEAMDFFGDKRTKDGKGITIPSQRRYVRYFERIVNFDKRAVQALKAPPPILLRTLILHTAPSYDFGGGCALVVEVRVNDGKHVLFKSPPLRVSKHSIDVEIDLGFTMVAGDIKIVLLDQDPLSKERMCHFWFNIAFVSSGRFELTRAEIDGACKDKHNKHFSEDFKIALLFDADALHTKVEGVSASMSGVVSGVADFVTTRWEELSRAASVIAHRMADRIDGVKVADRRWRLKKHSGCFVGSDAVDWLVSNCSDVIKSRAEAVVVGSIMRNQGIYPTGCFS